MVEYITRKNNKPDKPNEDYIFVDEKRKIFILLDGVTRDREEGKYPCPSPTVEVNKIFVETFIDVINKEGININTEGELKRVIERANDAIKKYNMILSHRFPAGTVGVIVVLTREGFIYAYIGDCYGAILSDQRIDYFTEPQTKSIVNHKREFTSDQIRFEICNNPEHPYAYGVWDGNIKANAFVVTGEKKIYHGEKIILFSDGANGINNRFSIKEIYEQPLSKIADKMIGSTEDDYTIIRIL